MQFAQAYDPFRSLQASWKLLKQTPLTVLIGGLLLSFLDSGNGGIGNTFNWNSQHRGDSVEEILEQLRPMLMVLIPMVVCIGIVMFLFSCWVQVGFARAIEVGLRTGKDDIGKVFDGSGRFVQMVLARLLCGLISLVSIIPLVVAAVALWFVHDRHEVEDGFLVLIFCLAVLVWLPFFIYLALGFSLIAPVIAYEDVGPTSGIARSWELARGNRLRLFWFWLVLTIFSGIGCCACCIGALLTMPMAQAMRFEAYMALKSGDRFPEWWVGTGRFPFDAPVQSTMQAPGQAMAQSMPPSSAPAPGAWGSAPARPAVPPSEPPPPAPPSPPQV